MIACTAALVAALSGVAEAAAPDADAPILVTASRTGDAEDVTTADRTTIERRQSSSLLDILNDLPGVRAFSTGGPAGGSFLSIRGGEPNFTTVLIDGVRLNQPTDSEGGAFDFALLDPSAIDHVEVARTAGSAIHGSDALSGIVQIVTRDPASGPLAAGAQGWVDSRYGGSASASLTGGWGNGGLRLSGGHYDSGDGDPAGELRRSQALGRARQSLGSFRLDALGLYAKSHGWDYPEDSGGPLLAVIRTHELRDADLALGSLALSRDPANTIRPSLSLAYSRQHDDSDAPAIAPGVLDGVPATVAATRFTRLEATGAITADIGIATLSAGGVLLREHGRSDGTLDLGFPLSTNFALTRVTHSGFGEASVHPATPLTLNGAARYDRLVGGSGNWTGRGGIAWQIAHDGPRLIARIANGYKRPSLYALGHPLIGNPALKPETSRSIEAGVDWSLPGVHLALTYFDNRFRNLIDFDPGLFALVNRDKVSARGAEAEASVRIGHGWSITSVLTHVTLDSATPLRGRPAWNGNARLNWESGRWQATVAVRGTSAFNDSSIPTGAVVTAGHAEADAGVRFALTDRLGVRLSLLDLGNDRSPDAVGTPSPGRSVRIALTLN